MASPVTERLPRELLDADRRYGLVLERHAFSTYLNPVNVTAARLAFDRGAEAPPFEYQPFDEADDALRELEALLRPVDHPLGRLVADVAQETMSCIVALRDRTPEAFHALNTISGWYPTDAELAPPPGPAPELPPAGAPVETVPADRLCLTFRLALRERGWSGWDVTLDPVMSARVLVDAPRRRVRVNPRARFRPREVVALVAHEIDVHVRRAENGREQPLTVFVTGLAASLATEEGLAIWGEASVGTLTPLARAGQRLIARAVDVARRASFRELYEWLRAESSGESAWTLSLRLKRGLGDAGQPGVYAKDSVYYVGYSRILGAVAEGRDLSALLAGKVGLEDPVDAWVAAGWMTPPRSLPAWFSAEAVSPPG